MGMVFWCSIGGNNMCVHVWSACLMVCSSASFSNRHHRWQDACEHVVAMHFFSLRNDEHAFVRKKEKTTIFIYRFKILSHFWLCFHFLAGFLRVTFVFVSFSGASTSSSSSFRYFVFSWFVLYLRRQTTIIDNIVHVTISLRRSRQFILQLQQCSLQLSFSTVASTTTAQNGPSLGSGGWGWRENRLLNTGLSIL